MKNITQRQLNAIIAKHKLYLDGIDINVRAVFRGINLSGLDMTNQDLRYAHFDGAEMLGTDLRGADLSFASFQNALLLCVDLSHAILRCTDFAGAQIIESEMMHCDCSSAFLQDTRLDGTNLLGCTGLSYRAEREYEMGKPQ
jgi:uncharacterized protein YjbI with pentapeptide repeats